MNEDDPRSDPPEEAGEAANRNAETAKPGSRALFAAMLLWGMGKPLAKRVERAFESGNAPADPTILDAKTSGRGADLNMGPERQTARHLRRGTFLVVCASLLALAGGLGFLWIYWTGGDNVLLGGSLALFLGGIGLSLVLFARWLMLEQLAIEPREELSSTAHQREVTAEQYYGGADEIHRRGLLAWIGLATVGFAAAIVVSLFRSLGKAPDPTLFDTIWRRGRGLAASDGTLVSVDALQEGSTMIVFPEDRIGDERAQTVLIRVNEHLLQLPRARTGWAPMGYIAYSRVCTHAGCAVGLFEATSDLLMCPCHQSTFDVLRAAKPTGGPAVRPLPQVPLYADARGILRAAGGFSEPPGPGFWGMP